MTAQVVAYDYLKEGILTGRLRAGTVISPDETAKNLNLSRMPVREALFHLESEGLVTFGSNRRPMVTVLSPGDVVEIFEIRIALECLAVERAVVNMSDQLIDELELQIIRMRRGEESPRKWIDLHAEFHNMIYEHSEMPRLVQEIERLRCSTTPYISMYINVHKVPELPGFEHEWLLGVFKTRDPELARAALAEHIRSAATDVVCFLSESCRNKKNTKVPTA